MLRHLDRRPGCGLESPAIPAMTAGPASQRWHGLPHATPMLPRRRGAHRREGGRYSARGGWAHPWAIRRPYTGPSAFPFGRQRANLRPHVRRGQGTAEAIRRAYDGGRRAVRHRRVPPALPADHRQRQGRRVRPDHRRVEAAAGSAAAESEAAPTSASELNRYQRCEAATKRIQRRRRSQAPILAR
jgi:hypothetical protein